MLWSAKIRRSFWVFVINQGKSVMISTQVIESLGMKISLKTITISQQEEKMRKIICQSHHRSIGKSSEPINLHDSISTLCKIKLSLPLAAANLGSDEKGVTPIKTQF